MKDGVVGGFFLGIFVLMAIFLMHFVFADIIVRTSIGGTSFSVNEDVQSIYNISVNNTNAGSNANITQVNITIPSNFTFTAGTNATSSGANTFVNTTTVLSWSNSTDYTINGSETRYFWFNATVLTPGAYNITVTSVNGTGSFSSNISVTINDTTFPTINFVSPTLSTNTFYIRSNITFNVTSSDNVAIGAINVTLYNSNNALVNSSTSSSSPFNGAFTGLGDGIYYLNASVNDTSGNINSTSTLKIILASSSFEFNGTVFDSDGNALNNSLVNISVRNTSNQFSVVGYLSTTTNASGWFNLSIYQENTNSTWMYQPVITLTNSTLNYVQYIGQSLPAFPSFMIQQIAGTKFYLKDAGTINITAVNATGASVPFLYHIKDIKLGYLIAGESQTYATQKTIYVPKDRNYSIMIFPNQSMPVSFEWDNFSATTNYTLSDGFSTYNSSINTVNKRFNISMSYVRLHGYVNNSGVTGWNNFTIVAYMLEPGNMVHPERGAIPYNLSASFVVGGTDIYNLSTGFYNISLPSTAEISTIMLFATGTNSSAAYGSLMNVSFNSSASPAGTNIQRNFTMHRLLGQPAIVSLNNLGGGTFNVSTAMYSFGLINSSNATLSNVNAHSEITVDYSSNISGIKSFTWMADIGQGSSSSLQAPLLNISSIGIEEINVFAGGGNYAPKRTTFTNAQLQSARNITFSSFNPGDIDGANISSNLKIALFKSNSTCDVPDPSSACVLGSTESTSGEDFSNFNPMSAVMGGGKISFRMGLLSSGIIVHYANVDMIASGPPDALFDDSATTSTSGSFESAMRFGSNGPTIYDYVLISMPYTEGSSSQTGLSESGQVNISIPLFYDENWNVLWNASSNGTSGTNLAGNNSHYSTYSSQWETLMGNNTCITNVSNFNSTNPCYINTTSNRIWIRLPHFSGTQPQVTGAVVTAATSSSSSPGSGGGSSSSGKSEWAKQKIHSWAKITPGNVTIMKDFDKDLGLKEIQIEVNNPAQNVKITVRKYDGKPANVSVEKSGKVYKYLQILEENLKEKLKKATLKIKVEKSWMSNNNLAKDNITLFRFNENSKQWDELTTNYAEEDSDNYYYNVELISFSYFAIGEKKVAAAEVTGGAVSGDETGGEAAGAGGEEKGKGKSSWLVLVIIAILVIVVIFVLYNKNKSRRRYMAFGF